MYENSLFRLATTGNPNTWGFSGGRLVRICDVRKESCADTRFLAHCLFSHSVVSCDFPSFFFPFSRFQITFTRTKISAEVEN